MAHLRRRRIEREDIQHNHDDFYEAIPYQQSLIADDDLDEIPVAHTSQATRIIYAILAVVEVLLATRLLLKLLGANTANAFVNGINTISYPLVRPFVGMFTATLDSVQGFSVPAAVAIAVYAVIALLIITLIRAFTAREY